MINILLVDDDFDICEIIKINLSSLNCNLYIANDGKEALSHLHNHHIDLVLLDIMLPDLDGVDFCGEIRKISNCPIIFISCIDDDNTIVKALEMGGDDYLVKPFNTDVLIARIEANLRRIEIGINKTDDSTLKKTFGNCIIDSSNHTVIKNREKIYLSPLEFKILNFMVDNPNQILSLNKIYDNIWTTPSYGDVRTVKVHVSNIRKKIEDDPADPQYITTIRRIGYYFVLENKT
ncbi:response regulator transcription factor [Alkalibaculum bacchi]|uniref:response regulator transcription factor n=1 Tax=Alkalibaculum bacchi TaxID=645887 RepID=UPI0026EB688D|nr:response regulator transcription factor [Alkalibaculum bacchi]